MSYDIEMRLESFKSFSKHGSDYRRSDGARNVGGFVRVEECHERDSVSQRMLGRFKSRMS